MVKVYKMAGGMHQRKDDGCTRADLVELKQNAALKES
jgi:hypothetical protein